MSRTLRPVRVAAATAMVGAAVFGTTLPANAAGSDNGSVSVVNTETIQVYTDSAGKVQSKHVYEQLAMSGRGKVDLSNPVETSGLRNLDGFSGFDVKGHDQIIKTTVDGSKQARSVSNYMGKLPLDVSAAYFLNGKRVNPSDIVGADGSFEARYTVKNITGEPEQLTVPDGKGGSVTKTVNVPVPMVGSLTTTAPSSFTDVVSKDANMAGDGEGGTTLSFTMTLFPPLGSDTATFGYTAKIHDGVVPDASISALPVNPMQSPTFASAATSYQSGAGTGAQLASGAAQIDTNLLKLRDGAGNLLAGLLKLQTGAQQLDNGLSGDAAPGARKLADGLKQVASGSQALAAGSKKAAAGSTKLASGTGDALAGGKQLTAGLAQISGGLGQLSGSAGLPSARAGALALKAGVDQILAGLGSVNDQTTLIGGLAHLGDGLGALETGATQLQGGLGQLLGDGSATDPGLVGAQGGVDQVRAGLDDAVNAGGQLDQLVAGLSSVQTLAGCAGDPRCTGTLSVIIGNVTASKAQLTQGRDGLTQVSGGLGQAITGLRSQLIPGAGQITAGLSTAQAGAGQLQAGAVQAKGGLQQVGGGLDTLVTGLTDAVSGVTKLSSGASVAYDGSGSLTGGLQKLDAGANQLASGNGQLVTGADQLSSGSGQLSTGAQTLADGLDTAADGSRKLAKGLSDAAGGAPQLVSGAQKLSTDGTQKLVKAGAGTAVDYGTLYATIKAGAARADTEAMAFGAPKGAIGLTAYSFEMKGDNGEGQRDLTRGVGGAILLALGGGALALRRRRA